MLSWPTVAPTPQLAYEARKAPGGSYHHNIFHQSEHLLCMLHAVYTRREAPELILWPYTITPWADTSLASARPAAPPALKGAHPHANRTTASFGDDERACHTTHPAE